MWKSQRKWLFLPLVLSLWLSAGSTSQAEEMYQMSESELTRLEANLNQLAKNSETKQNLLNKQKIQIEMLNSQLEKANSQLEESKKEIQKSKTLNEATQKSLDKANKYLREYEQEVKHKMEVKDRQLRTWKGISVVLAGIVVKKATK